MQEANCRKKFYCKAWLCLAVLTEARSNSCLSLIINSIKCLGIMKEKEMLRWNLSQRVVKGPIRHGTLIE